jgi:hypothetical protein
VRGVNVPGSGWMTCGWCESGWHERCIRFMRAADPERPDRHEILCACAEKGHAQQGVLR